MDSKLSIVMVAIAVAVAAPAARAADTGSSIGVGLGYVKARRVDSTIILSGDFRFPLVGPFSLAPDFSYWKKSESSVGITSSVEDLQFGVDLLAVLPLGRRLRLFLGGGGGIHHITGNVGVTGSTVVSDSTTKGGLDAQTGIEIAAGDNLGFFLSGRYDWVLGLSGEVPRRLDQYRFLGGFRVRF